VSAAEWAYRLLLRAYPAEFRAAYGREMTQLFNDRRRDAGAARTQFWAAMLADIAKSAPAMRFEEWAARRSDNFHVEGRTMKTMAILAILIGTLEVVSSAAEAWVGGLVLHGGYSLAAGAVAAAAGALLVASAIAMLRGSKGAVSLAQGSAIACIAVFALVAALRPIFSILSTMLGIGFPIALLLYLRVTQGRGPSAPIAA
jgi:hypothetical protein